MFSWEPADEVDFLFEDGAHTPGFTKRVLQHLRPRLMPGATILCHDYHHRQFGMHIVQEFTEVFGDQTRGVLIAPSDCGLGYARYLQSSEPA